MSNNTTYFATRQVHIGNVCWNCIFLPRGWTVNVLSNWGLINHNLVSNYLLLSWPYLIFRGVHTDWLPTNSLVIGTLQCARVSVEFGSAAQGICRWGLRSDWWQKENQLIVQIWSQFVLYSWRSLVDACTLSLFILFWLCRKIGYDVTRLPTVIYSTSLRLRTSYKYSVNRDLSLTNPDLWPVTTRNSRHARSSSRPVTCHSPQ